MSQSTSRLAMNIFVIALCVCATLARPDDAQVDKKPVAKLERILRSSPVTYGKLDASISTVSEEVLDRVLNDRRFVQKQLKCATGEGPCDSIGRKLKARAPLVLKGTCVKCSQAEIKQVQRIMSYIQTYYPEEYAKILKQYQIAF